MFANDLPTKGFLQTVDYKKIQDQTNELLIKFGHPEINSKDIVNSLSVGQRQIVEIIKALSLNSNIIIFTIKPVFTQDITFGKEYEMSG